MILVRAAGSRAWAGCTAEARCASNVHGKTDETGSLWGDCVVAVNWETASPLALRPATRQVSLHAADTQAPVQHRALSRFHSLADFDPAVVA